MQNVLSVTIDAKEYDRLCEVDRKFSDLSKLINANDPKFVTVLMIANAHGISRQDALNRPWLLPNFGKVDNSSESRRKRFWRFDEYLDWVAIPEFERIREYKQLNNY
ncbi:hypothetical protein SDC9_196833 [bioreactor metagenome]|uniref:Uncharacterized protein n=1 Tax=bioreactor metagenome TaxID=1076179 RepID=A0A645ID33_9ZZZZ